MTSLPELAQVISLVGWPRLVTFFFFVRPLVTLLQANIAAMAVFSPLDTNVIPGFQYSSAATPLSSFPQGGARTALASWSKKPAEQTASTPTATLAGTYAGNALRRHSKDILIGLIFCDIDCWLCETSPFRIHTYFFLNYTLFWASLCTHTVLSAGWQQKMSSVALV